MNDIVHKHSLTIYSSEVFPRHVFVCQYLSFSTIVKDQWLHVFNELIASKASAKGHLMH